MYRSKSSKSAAIWIKKMVKYDLFLEAKYNFDTNCVALSVQKIPILVGFTWSDVDFVCKVTVFKLRH